MTSPLVAFADESMIGSRRSDGSAYILVAAVLDDRDVASARVVVQALLLPRQDRLHWRKEGEQRRHSVTKALSDLDVTVVAVRQTGVEPRKQERARRLCLARLLWELSALRVADLIIESRQAHRDAADVHALGGFRSQGLLLPTLRVRHLPPLGEPLLWIADSAAGAVREEMLGDDSYVEAWSAKMSIVDIGGSSAR